MREGCGLCGRGLAFITVREGLETACDDVGTISWTILSMYKIKKCPHNFRSLPTQYLEGEWCGLQTEEVCHYSPIGCS